MITALRLRELLNYDPVTGVFTHRKGNRIGEAGRVAGHIKKSKGGGYTIIVLDGECFRAARLAWVYMTGEWPDYDVDHKNLCRSDDRWSNLRLATRSQNMANGELRLNNTSGHRGVTWDYDRSKWRAQVMCNGKNHYCGIFDSIEDAAKARDAKALLLFGDFARANIH